MNEFKDGNRAFKELYFTKHEKELVNLAKNGQSPQALFIGCSDSRVIPDLFLNTKPGDLFVVRNVGNFVPKFTTKKEFRGTASAIEYAVSVLNVSEIIVCGHTHCGACETLHKPEKVEHLPHLTKWLEIGEEAKNRAVATNMSGDDLYRITEKFSILSQLENLLTYPEIKRKVESNEIYIHGWYYHIESGEIEYYDPDVKKFLPLSET
jgi:carbonic anhydrase